jgi:hypothetical protein
MNNEILIDRLKRAERYYIGDMSKLCRDALAEIETLVEEVKGFKELLGTYDTILKGRNEEVARLQAELDNLPLTSHSDKDVAIRNDDLTVRDHIAIAAMEGFISVRGWHPDHIIPAGGGHVGGQRAADAVAEQAYVYADAILKVRKVRGKKNA